MGRSAGRLALLSSPCPSLTTDQLPQRRCGHEEGHTHQFPDALLVSDACVVGQVYNKLLISTWSILVGKGSILLGKGSTLASRGSTLVISSLPQDSQFCLLTSGGSRLALPDFTDMLMTVSLELEWKHLP